MKYFAILFFVFSSLFASGTAFIKPVDLEIRAHIVVNNKVYAITQGDYLLVWDLLTQKRLYTGNSNKEQFISLGKDNNGAVFLGSRNGKVYKLDTNDFSVTKALSLNKGDEIRFIYFNSQNKMYLILQSGIYDVANKKGYNEFYNPPGGMIVQQKNKKGVFEPTDIYFLPPAITFLDSKNRIWMSKSMGEFGTTLYIFDIDRNEIIKRPEGVDNIQGFAEGADGNIYISGGLQHFMNFGEIYKVDKDMKVMKLYDSDFDFEGNKQESKNRIFIGPCAWNETEKRLYFASSYGFFKANVSNGNKLTNVQKVFEQSLTYVREPMAIGMQMAVKEMTFLSDNRLLFRTAANGLGVYGGIDVVVLE
jgi:outer membrane protein assembly factor BamB